MIIYVPVNYAPDDGIYVYNFGFENTPEMAHWGPGRRDCCILHYILEGSGFFNGNPVGEGSGFYISPGMLQEYHTSTDRPWRYFWIMVSGEQASRVITDVVRPDDNGIFSVDFLPKLRIFLDQLRCENRPLSHFTSLSYFYQVMDMHYKAMDMRRRADDQENPLVRSAKTYIDSNYHTKITVRSTADALHISDRYLYNLFVQYTGTTPKAYIDDRRIQAACDLLLNTDNTVSEIAVAVGFDDVCRFSHFFKGKTGVTPTQYRRAK